MAASAVPRLPAEHQAFLLTPDSSAPVIGCPPAVNVAVVGQQPASMCQATATDNLDPNPTISNNAPVTFPGGISLVIWIARDASGAGNTGRDMIKIDLAANDSDPNSIDRLTGDRRGQQVKASSVRIKVLVHGKR